MTSRVLVGELLLGLHLEEAAGEQHRAGDEAGARLVLLAHVEQA